LVHWNRIVCPLKIPFGKSIDSNSQWAEKESVRLKE
jgi:hypothetical protein